METPPVEITVADFTLPVHAQALQVLMQHYACDPMGGGSPLPEDLLQSLPQKLKNYPGSFSVLAWQNDLAVGLINCFEGFSTFKAKPLLNIHDVVVLSDLRGHGIARLLLAEVEKEARRRGCCKLTLEVLSGNHRACEVYKASGFKGYELDPQCGQAVFMEKGL